ncbi:MAG: tetratricopeptide repeat protein [Gammaproteobacteria bacterium]|nr:tetratricopeptide repeat protein [Gammaproteobacteria bacterium]
MKRCLKSNLNKYIIRAFFLSSLLALFSNASFAGLSGVKTIVITASKSNISGYLQISEVIATQTESGKDLALATEGAIATSSAHYGNAKAINAISGVGPDSYPKIFHSNRSHKTASLNITLASESELDSIILYGRADSHFNRDIYDITLKDASGKIIFTQSNLNAASASHSVSVNLTGDFSIETKVSEISNVNSPGSQQAANLFNEALIELKNEKQAKGIKKIINYIGKYPNGANIVDARLIMGKSRMKLNRKKAARIWFHRVINSFPDSKQAIEAKSHLAALNQIDANEASLLYKNALVALKNKNPSKGIQKINQYIAKYPKGFNIVDSYLILGNYRMKVKKKKAAKIWFYKVINNFPNSEHAVEAKKHLLTLKRINMKEAVIFFNNAITELENKSSTKGIQSIAKYIRQYPQGANIVDSYLIMGKSRMELNKKRAARNWLNKVIDNFPNSKQAAEAKKYLGMVNKERNAKIAEQEKRQKNIRDISKLYKEGQQALNSGELIKAEKIFTSVLKQNPRTIVATGAKNNLAYIERKKKNIEKRQKFAKTKSEQKESSFDELIKQLKDSQSPSMTQSKSRNYKISDLRPPSFARAYASYGFLVEFDRYQNAATAGGNIDSLMKIELLERAKKDRKTGSIGANVTFLVKGKDVERRAYQYYSHNNKWKPITGSALNRKGYQSNSTNKFSMLAEAAKFTNDEKALQSIFELGFYISDAKTTIPGSYSFSLKSKINKSWVERWRKKQLYKPSSYTLNVKVDVRKLETLIEDRDKLVNYVKLDLIKRLGNDIPDIYNAYYNFKVGNITLSKDGLSHGLKIDRNIRFLDSLAQSNEEEFTTQYRMSKAMFIAEQNGDNAKVKKLRASRAKVANSILSNNSVVLQISEELSKDKKLPLLYTSEALKWLFVGGMHPREIARELVSETPFPLNEPWSMKEIRLKVKQLEEKIKELSKKGENIYKSASRTNKESRSRVVFAINRQHQLAEQIFYPGMQDIFSRTIELLSKIPRSLSGITTAEEANDIVRTKLIDPLHYWSSILSSSPTQNLTFKNKIELCSVRSTNTNLGIDSKSGLCFYTIRETIAVLREAWRLQYTRAIDGLLAKQMTSKGAVFYLDEFCFAIECSTSDFPEGLTKENYMPPKNNKKCLYENCSSKLVKLYISETSDSVLTNDKKNQYLTTLIKAEKDLNSKWKTSANNSVRTEIVKYARDIAPKILRKLSNSASKELSSISKNDSRVYRNWSQKTSKPIRLQVVAWQKLWDIGFGIGKKENALSALGLQSFKSSYLNARHSGGSPFVNIAETLYDAQYKWLIEAEKSTTADASVKFPTSWSSSSNYKIPKQPKRHYAQLMTPSEIFFDSIGQQAGEAVSAIASYGSQIAQLEQKIKKSRTAFFKCLPNCSNLITKNANYSRSLVEKDIYFLQISGRSGSLVNKGQQNMSIMVEGLSGSRGFTLIDNGISKVCWGYFDRWVSKFSESHGKDGRNEIDANFLAIQKMATGNFSALQEQGFKMIKKQQAAFAKSATEYRKYQVCRDQYEFDSWENKHGDIKEDSSWFGF